MWKFATNSLWQRIYISEAKNASPEKRTQNHFSWCTNQSFLHFFSSCTIKHSQSLWCKYLLFNLFIRIIHSIDEMKRTENERGCSSFRDCHVPQYLNILPWSQTRCFFAASFSRLLCVRKKRARDGGEEEKLNICFGWLVTGRQETEKYWGMSQALN